MKINSLQRFLLYLTVIAAFTGVLFLSISLGPVHLFPYRFLLMIIWIIFLGSIFYRNGLLNIVNIKTKNYLIFFGLWMGYAFLSMLWAVDKSAAVRNVTFLFTGISIIFFLIYYLQSLNHLKWLYWLLIFIFVAQLPVGIWEVTTGNHLEIAGLFGETIEKLAFMPSAVFRNPNDYAAYIVLTLPLILVWVRYNSNMVGRIFGILVMILGLWILIMTFSRSSYIALLMGFAFWFLLLLPWKKKFTILALGGFLCVLLFVAFPTQIFDVMAKFTKQVDSLAPLVLQNENNVPDDARLNLIKNGLFFTTESMGFGVGAGNGDYYMANHAIYSVGKLTNMHNWWMEIMVNYGIFIFGGYVIFYLSLLYNLWRIHKRADNMIEKMICEALLVSLVSFFMASISSSSILAFPPHWIYLGFILAFLNYSRIKKIQNAYIAYSG